MNISKIRAIYPNARLSRRNKNNSPYGDVEQINKYKCIVCNINYKNALNYNKHIRDDTCSIFHRLEAVLPK